MGTLHLTTHFISRFQRWMAGDVSGPVYAAGEYGAGQARFFKTVDQPVRPLTARSGTVLPSSAAVVSI